MSVQFLSLEPHRVLDAVEGLGFLTTGACTQLNSYENRVFDIGLEDKTRVIAKFYRPGRWSREAILDEHQFLFELKEEGIPAVAPLVFQGESLFEQDQIYFCLFPKTLGRSPQEFLGEELSQVGRLLARIHNVGARKKAVHRPQMSVHAYAEPALKTLSHWIWPDLKSRYFDAAEELFDYLDPRLDYKSFIRIHGDCHKGNLLHSGSEFFFIDFDDYLNGPVEQDFWMLLSGFGDSNQGEWDAILKGYDELRSLANDPTELCEALRGLRLIHYSSWIVKRWHDPSFTRLFPEFNTYLYWLEELEGLEKIVARLS